MCFGEAFHMNELNLVEGRDLHGGDQFVVLAGSDQNGDIRVDVPSFMMCRLIGWMMT